MAIGIIGGTGVYDASLFKDIKQIEVETPYGRPSDKLTIGKLDGKKVVIIPRHGINHTFNPTNVPYRANIWAMKEQGVTRLISVSAVGSLKEEIRPGSFLFSDQFIDRTTKRIQTFYDKEKVCHIGVAEPFSKKLRQMLINKTKELGIKYHGKGTCVVIEGPRFSTKAESHMYKDWDAHIINMTLVPEVVLAREAQISYANIALVTDYDVWHHKPVSNQAVVETAKKNIEKVRKLLMAIIPNIDDEEVWESNKSLEGAFF